MGLVMIETKMAIETFNMIENLKWDCRFDWNLTYTPVSNIKLAKPFGRQSVYRHNLLLFWVLPPSAYKEVFSTLVIIYNLYAEICCLPCNSWVTVMVKQSYWWVDTNPNIVDLRLEKIELRLVNGLINLVSIEL